MVTQDAAGLKTISIGQSLGPNIGKLQVQSCPEASLQEDVTLQKEFALKEGINLALRADAFNIGNRHLFAEPANLNPNPNNPSSNFGFLTGTVDTPRAVQLQVSIRF